MIYEVTHDGYICHYSWSVNSTLFCHYCWSINSTLYLQNSRHCYKRFAEKLIQDRYVNIFVVCMKFFRYICICIIYYAHTYICIISSETRVKRHFNLMECTEYTIIFDHSRGLPQCQRNICMAQYICIYIYIYGILISITIVSFSTQQ